MYEADVTIPAFAISFMVRYDTQDEIDYYWEKLTADGGEPGQCGWLKDKFDLAELRRAREGK